MGNQPSTHVVEGVPTHWDLAKTFPGFDRLSYGRQLSLGPLLIELSNAEHAIETYEKQDAMEVLRNFVNAATVHKSMPKGAAEALSVAYETVNEPRRSAYFRAANARQKIGEEIKTLLEED